MLRSFLGQAPVLGRSVFVDESAVVIGRVRLGHDASVWPCVSIRGDLMWISIGDRSNIQDNSCLHTSRPNDANPDGWALNIGNEVTIGHSVTLHGCTIKDQVLVGMGSVVLDGAVLESRLIVGAKSLVPPGKILESGFLYLGNPVRKIRELTEKEHDFLKISAFNYVKLKDNYLTPCCPESQQN
jgi:carbonic anhydrase/acetyltransferase-like protein (isoleucine patch superfamily)